MHAPVVRLYVAVVTERTARLVPTTKKPDCDICLSARRTPSSSLWPYFLVIFSPTVGYDSSIAQQVEYSIRSRSSYSPKLGTLPYLVHQTLLFLDGVGLINLERQPPVGRWTRSTGLGVF